MEIRMKILCIIQARMGSERLPGKVMRQVCGRPMISYTLDRAKKSRYIDEIVLATSQKESEQPMVDYLTENGYSVFRGEENNVLKRYVDASEEYGGDVIIRLTGDCPLIDPVILDQVITYFLANPFDYVRLDVPESFIRGFDVEVFTKKALDRVYQIAKDLEEGSPYKEHVTLYMYRHPDEFSIGYVKGSAFYQKDYRLCVDTREDLALVEAVYEQLKDRFVSAREAVAFLDENPQMAGINQNIEQKQV